MSRFAPAAKAATKYVGHVTSVVCLLTLATGCASSNERLVAKATAVQTYYQASYENRCLKSPHPESCGRCQANLNDGLWKIQTANQTYKLGYLPPQEAYELRQLIVALEQCP